MSEPTIAIRCPSCGYDLSASRPPDGAGQTPCSECGTPIDWSDAGGGAQPVGAWCFDDAGVPAERLWGAAWLTTCRSLRPWCFWRQRVPISAMRWGRLGVLVLIWAAATYLLSALMLFIQGFVYSDLSQDPEATWRDPLVYATSWPLMFQYAENAWPLLCYLITPVGLLMLSTERAPVSTRRVGRAAICGLALPALLLNTFFAFTTAWFLLSFVWETSGHVYEGALFIATELVKWLVVAWTLGWWASVACMELRLRQWRLFTVLSFAAALLACGLIYIFWSANHP